MDTKDLDPTRKAPPQHFVDGQFHTVDREKMNMLRAQLHKNIDNMFEDIEYAPDGHAINPVMIEGKRDFEQLALPSGRLCHLQKAASMTLKIERTAAQFKADLDDAVAERGVYAPPAPVVAPSAEPTLAETLPSDFRISWRDRARVMYEAYGDSVNWKAVSGHPMPKFDDVGARVEGAWCIAAASSAFHAAVGAPKNISELITTRDV